MEAIKQPLVYSGTGSAIDNYFKPNKTKNDNWAIFSKKNPQHMNILSLARQAQWTIPSKKYGEVADLERISTFLKSDKSPVKKPLKDMEPEELSKVIHAFKGIVKSVFK